MKKFNVSLIFYSLLFTITLQAQEQPFSGLDNNLHNLFRLSDAQTRFSMYRWHITDPIRFRNDLRVTMQALGWRSGGRYLPLQDDISSVTFWYQSEPHAPFPKLPGKDELEIL